LSDPQHSFLAGLILGWRFNSWPHGLISFYGTSRPTDAGADWLDPAVVADPAKRGKIFSWKLTHTQDPFGNRIEYDYERH
jgi:hypothetical protein